MNHLNEETIMEVLADVMNEGQLENFEIDEQMYIIELITGSIRKYYSKELDNFLEDLHKDYKKDKLSDL